MRDSLTRILPLLLVVAAFVPAALNAHMYVVVWLAQPPAAADTPFTAPVAVDFLLLLPGNVAATGDFDGDGAHDVVARERRRGWVLWSPSRGATAPVELPADPVAAWVYDDDRDGFDDLFLATESGASWRLPGSDAGPLAGEKTHRRARLDLDGDGRADWIQPTRRVGPIEVRLGSGKLLTLSEDGDFGGWNLVGDVNGDGAEDVATVEQTRHYLRLRSPWWVTDHWTHVQFETRHALVTILGGDTPTVSRCDGLVFLYGSTFWPPLQALGDVDGDGFDDALLDEGRFPHLVFGGPDGLRCDRIERVPEAEGGRTLTGDFDGDGRHDLLISDVNGHLRMRRGLPIASR